MHKFLHPLKFLGQRPYGFSSHVSDLILCTGLFLFSGIGSFPSVPVVEGSL